MNDFDRSDMMDRIVFIVCLIGWGFLMYMIATGVI